MKIYKGPRKGIKEDIKRNCLEFEPQMLKFRETP